MIPTSPVVAIDDNQEELDAIVRALRSVDLACLPIKVTAAKADVVRPLTGVRLVFFDINYLPGTPNDAILFETAATVLEQVLAPNNGPYILVTWSTKSDKHDGLMRFFAEKVPNIPTPAMSGFLRKERFTEAVKAQNRPNEADLINEIRSVLEAHPQVEALMHWEGAASRAAGDVICSLLELTAREARFAGGAGSDLHGLLARVARNAVGPANALSDRRGAIHEALVPILFDRLVHQAPREDEIDLWTRAIDFQAAPSIGPDHERRLNGLSHLARDGSGPMVAGDRGVVFALAGDTAALLADRCALTPPEIASQFVRMPKPPKGDRPGLDMEMLSREARWVFVGTRAICDQAQDKGVLRPLVLALEVPADWKKSGGPMQIEEHGALAETPPFALPDADGVFQPARKLVANWHWTISLSLPELDGAQSLYRIREPLMSQVSSQMSGYISRPGIIDYSAKA